MSDYATERHFRVSKKEKESLSDILDKPPYIVIKQSTTEQEVNDEQLMDVWIRFGFEDPNIPNIPKHLSYEELKRIIEGYVEVARNEDMMIEAYTQEVLNVINSDYTNYIRQMFLECDKIQTKIKEEMTYGIRLTVTKLTGKRPTANQLEKILKFWKQSRFDKYDCPECTVKQHRLDAKSDEIVMTYMNYAVAKGKTCAELSLLDAMEEFKDGFAYIIEYCIVADDRMIQKWIEGEKEQIKEFLVTT